jgi:hypothetical protein
LSYSKLSIPAKVTGAMSLTVLVDLGLRQVVSIMPPDSTLSAVPGTSSVTVPAPGGPNGS